ncbi:hypothetical protein D3C78_1755640 [compost metagenome]
MVKLGHTLRTAVTLPAAAMRDLSPAGAVLQAQHVDRQLILLGQLVHHQLHSPLDGVLRPLDGTAAAPDHFTLTIHPARQNRIPRGQHAT